VQKTRGKRGGIERKQLPRWAEKKKGTISALYERRILRAASPQERMASAGKNEKVLTKGSWNGLASGQTDRGGEENGGGVVSNSSGFWVVRESDAKELWVAGVGYREVRPANRSEHVLGRKRVGESRLAAL